MACAALGDALWRLIPPRSTRDRRFLPIEGGPPIGDRGTFDGAGTRGALQGDAARPREVLVTTSPIRANAVLVRAAAFAITAALSTGATLAAAPGQLVVHLHGAHAKKKFDDGCCWNKQDFYAIVQFPGDAPLETGWDLGYDDVSWLPPNGVAYSKDVDRTHRFHAVSVQLWDDDDGKAGNANGDDDKFDINPGPPDQLDIQFDACTMQWTANGLFSSFGPGPTNPGFGNGPPADLGSLDLELTTGDGLPFTPDKLTIVGLDPVQAAFDPKAVISGKPTALRVKVANTFAGDVSSAVTVQASDGLATWTETRTLTFAAGAVSTFYVLDGMPGHQPSFTPVKPANVAHAFLTYSAELALRSDPPPGTPPDLLDCYIMRNGLFGKTTPLVRTIGPRVRGIGELTVFQPFDYLDTAAAPFAWEVATMADDDEAFRKALWPVAATPHVVVPLPLWAPPPPPLSPIPEPAGTIQIWSIAASVAGIDRLVLVPRKHWFAQNVWRPLIWNDKAIGQSNGEFGAHAVIAEYGYKGVSTHELGHTYKLSPHTCDHPTVFGVGCRDEYTYTPTIMGTGLDVLGTIFPGGANCSPQTPNSREVCLPNLMNAQSENGFVNWIEPFTYDFLVDQLKDERDPELINLSGALLQHAGPTPTAPPTFSAQLQSSYHFDGTPDVADPRQGTPPAAATGGGKFALRLSSADGTTRTYRFEPYFATEGSTADATAGLFSFNVAWDPSLEKIDVLAPSDVRVGDCPTDAPCGSVDTVVASRSRSPNAPQVSVLRAGRDVAPPLGGAAPPVPTIGPGHQAVLAWNATDADGDALHAVVLLAKFDPTGQPVVWTPVGVEVAGNQLALPHAQLTADPGDYVAQVAVSDGMNGASFTSGTVFRVCNPTNQGAEICDGLDNDCDGTVDNALPPPGSIGVSVSRSAISWTGVAAAERYDVVRGNVATLRATGGSFARATEACLANDTTASSVSFPNDPPAGAGWWFLVRGSNCLASGTYDEDGHGQAAPRDAGIASSPGACP